MGLTQDLAEFVAGIEPARLSRAAVDTVTRGLADCFGVMIAGRDEPVAQLAAGMIDTADTAGTAGTAGTAAIAGRGVRRARVLGLEERQLMR